MVDLSPVDYISGLGGIQNLPNPAQDQAAVQGLRTTELQQNAAQFQLDQARTQQGRTQQFQQDIVSLGADPNPSSIAGLIRKYPEFAKQLKDAHDVQDEAKKASDFRAQAQVWSAANAGRFDLAAQLLQDHENASIAAGEAPDPFDAAIITALKSGDPAEQKRAMSMIGLSVASINPGKFDDTYKVLNPEGDKGVVVGGDGSALVNPRTGEVLFQSERKPEYRNVGPGDTVVEIGGGSPAPTGPAIEAIVAQLVPGAVVTSGKRTPEKNAEVGGVPNSRHLDDAARDYVPPEGMSMAQLEKNLRAGLPGGYRVINEGDHVHVQAASRGGSGSRVVAQVAPKQVDPPSGYRWAANGNLEAIPGGPGDKKYGQQDRKAETDLRKEFNALPEVKSFKTVRTAFNQIRALAKEPSAQNDIAMIFSYMKMLDPDSVVREGEFATAQNATGVPDQIRNAWNKALSGERLNPEQRKSMMLSAANVYGQQRNTYNATANQYQAYAADYGLDPKRIAPKYTRVGGGAPAGFRIVAVRPK